jgi:hypothetical protein
MNLYQERMLVLTDKAYWTFKYDFNSNKIDDKHFKRHDLLDFSICDIGDFDKIGDTSLKALKIFTHERRKVSVLTSPEINAIDKKGKGHGSKALRNSINLKESAIGDLDMFKNLVLTQNYDKLRYLNYFKNL